MLGARHSSRRNLVTLGLVLGGAGLACMAFVEPIWAQHNKGEPAGLPSAPRYIPGTAITPEREVEAPLANRAGNESAQEERRRRRSAMTPVTTVEKTADVLPKDGAVQRERGRPPPLAAAAGLAVHTDHPVWRKLAPLLPEPGNFAIIPGSALRPFLVQEGEFPFCDEIKCHRSDAVLRAWNGGAFDPERGQFRLHGGGHGDYGGNEVYAFDFSTLSWARETEPQPLTGPMLRDTDENGVADACPAPAAGPPASHTYQGFVYVPKIDRYWLFGTVEYCAHGRGGQSAWEYDATRRAWEAMPELDRYAKFARTVVNPASGNVLIHVGRRRGWHEIDPQSRSVMRTFTDDDLFGSYTDGPAVFDSQRQVIYAVIGGKKKDRLVAYRLPAQPSDDETGGFSGRTVAQWPKQGLKAWGMAQHTSGLLVLWDGNTRILTVDPQTGQSWEMDTGGDDYDSGRRGGKPARVYSKWGYIAEVDTFFGITSADQGIVLYRLGSAVLPDADGQSSDAAGRREQSAARATGKPPGMPDTQPLLIAGTTTTSAAGSPATEAALPSAPPTDNGWKVPLEIKDFASWEEVCNKAVLCDPLGDGEVIYRGRVVEAGPPQRRRNWRSTSQKFNHPEAKEPTADPVVGGLRFAFPSRSGSGAAGNFSTNFSPDYSFQVGPEAIGAAAQEVFIQFQVRYSCTFIWTDCDPASANYRKERRCFLSKRGNGRCTASKIALISTGDREGDSADACTRIQTAINHTVDHSLHGFHRCPRANGFGERLPRQGGRYQGDTQPNGLYYCPRILGDGTEKSWNNSPDTCFRLVDDRWITIQVRLRFGPWQSHRKKGDPQLSHASIWAGIEGQNGGRQQLVIDNDFYATDPKGSDLVGKIWLMPHLYNKTNTEEHPPFFVWYRNLVISQTLLPNPT